MCGEAESPMRHSMKDKCRGEITQSRGVSFICLYGSLYVLYQKMTNVLIGSVVLAGILRIEPRLKLGMFAQEVSHVPDKLPDT